jgi:hypothetical protein
MLYRRGFQMHSNVFYYASCYNIRDNQALVQKVKVPHSNIREPYVLLYSRTLDSLPLGFYNFNY